VTIGCATIIAPTYQPGIENTETLLQDRGKLAVDGFQAAAGVKNTALGVRGARLRAGSDGTFSTYLQDALIAELVTAGRHDAASTTVLSGTLTTNRLSAASTVTGSALLGAHFVVTREHEELYSKTINVEHTWQSSFMGAVAIPTAIQNYVTAMQKLVGQLFADPEFRAIESMGIAPSG
jgi:hypothetical protein